MVTRLQHQCNSQFLVAPQIKAAVSIPLLHIANATAEEIKKAGISKIGLWVQRLRVKPEDTEVKLFDTTEIHALKAVERALG